MTAKATKQPKPRKERKPLFKNRQQLFAAAGAALSLATTAAVAATVVVGHAPLLSRAAALKQSELKVAFDWPPLAGKSTSRTAAGAAEPATWLNAEQRAELEQVAIKLLTGNPFDRESMERTQRALQATGWFAEGGGPWLRRYENGVVVVNGRWRVPAAAVRTTEGDRLVAEGGEALPPVYPPGRSGMTVITGVRTAAPSLGEKWPGGDVQAGLKLATFLRPTAGASQIAAIDVSDFTAGKRLSIETTTGGKILWGGPPDEFLPGQAPAATKRQRLAALYQQFGQLDAGRPRIDVRSEDGVYTDDPSASAEASTASPSPKIPSKPDARSRAQAKNRR